MEKQIRFDHTAPYSFLNELTTKTTDIWIVCHGYGQLSTNFIRRFDVLDSSTIFVIALQGLSRFYLPNHQDVGASWMTKVDREIDMINQKKYFDAVLEDALKGASLNNYKINLLGFSQGVSMVSRMAVYRQIAFSQMILWAGGFPTELKKEDFEYLPDNSKLKVVLGKQDQYYPIDQYQNEIANMTAVIGLVPEVIHFDGKHEMKRAVLSKFV